MTVDIEKLELAIRSVISHLKANGVESVEINEDFYWNIGRNEIYDPLKTPSDLDLGQLSDDWARLVAMSNDRQATVGYGLVWAASILRRIGELHVG